MWFLKTLKKQFPIQQRKIDAGLLRLTQKKFLEICVFSRKTNILLKRYCFDTQKNIFKEILFLHLRNKDLIENILKNINLG